MNESGGGKDFDLTRVAEVVDLKSGRRASASPVAGLGGLGESVLDRFTATGAPADGARDRHSASGSSGAAGPSAADSTGLDWRRPLPRPAKSGRRDPPRPVALVHHGLEWVRPSRRARRPKTAPTLEPRRRRRAVVVTGVIATAVVAVAVAVEVPASRDAGDSHGPLTQAASIAGGALDGFAPKPNVSRLAQPHSSRPSSDPHKPHRRVPAQTARRHHVERTVGHTATARTATALGLSSASVSSPPPTVTTTAPVSAPSSLPVSTPSSGSSSSNSSPSSTSSKQPAYGPNGILGPGHGDGTG
jgi:hypothetical protein